MLDLVTVSEWIVPAVPSCIFLITFSMLGQALRLSCLSSSCRLVKYLLDLRSGYVSTVVLLRISARAGLLCSIGVGILKLVRFMLAFIEISNRNRCFKTV